MPPRPTNSRRKGIGRHSQHDNEQFSNPDDDLSSFNGTCQAKFCMAALFLRINPGTGLVLPIIHSIRLFTRHGVIRWPDRLAHHVIFHGILS